jgi:hypothetical protein
MGLSPVAEFYANYGEVGGWIGMFAFGLMLSYIIRWLILVPGKGSQVIILWFVFFFFQVVKAETDLIKIINHLVKSILFFLFLQALLKSFNKPLFVKALKRNTI